MWLLIAFIAVPLIEIALFIKVGGLIGLGWTLVTVVITAILGTWLVKSQGAQAIGQLQRSFSDLHDPTEPLLHGAMILFSGALLLTPGFFTDAIGFALLVPAVRTAISTAVRARVKMHSFEASSQGMHRHPDPQSGEGDVIEGEYVEISEEERQNRGPSDWTKH